MSAVDITPELTALLERMKRDAFAESADSNEPYFLSKGEARLILNVAVTALNVANQAGLKVAFNDALRREVVKILENTRLRADLEDLRKRVVALESKDR